MSVHQKILKKYNNNPQQQEQDQSQFQQQQQQQQQPQQIPEQFQSNFTQQNNTQQTQNNVQNTQNQYQQQQNQPQTQPQQQQFNQQQQQQQQQSNYSQAQTPSQQNEQQRKQEILEFSSYFNATKQHVRPTTDYFPKTLSLQRDSRMQYAASIQPLGQFHEPVPTASFGQDPILRCDYCRAYLNPFCKFIEQGYRWKCNLCGKSEPVPSRYYQPLDENGYRQDINDRAELYSGTFDIKAGQDYCARPPMPPSYFFLIDVSKTSVESGALNVILNQIKESIQNKELNGGERTQVGIITFDSHIHLYMMKAGMKQPQMVVLTDPKEPELPIPDDLLINVEDNQDLLLNLLESMPNMFNHNTNETPTSFIFALEVALKVFKPVGGHLMIFQSSNTLLQDKIFQPKQQQGNNNNNNNQNQDKSQLLIPSSPHFRNLSNELHIAFITTSIFVFSNTFKNIINLCDLARYLNGEIYTYHDTPTRLQQFYYDFKQAVTKDIAWESVFRVRVSPGWKTTQIYGNYSIKTSDLLSFLTDDKKVLTYEFELEDTIARTDTFALQTALLFTNSNGERRIRVHNYQLPLTTVLPEIFEHADASALAMIMAKRTLHQIFQNPNMQLLKQQFLQKSKDVISTVMSVNKNNIPDSLLQFPLNILGVLKHRLFNNYQAQNLECDLVNSLRINLLSMSLDEMITYFVPYIFDLEAIHNDEDQTLSLYNEEGVFNFPPSIGLNFGSLSIGGLFLMDAGNVMYLFINQENVNQDLLQDIIGVKDVSQLENGITEDNLYHNSNNKINEKIYNLLNELRRGKGTQFTSLQFIISGQKSVEEYDFYYKMIEDKFDGYKQGYNMDYNTFTSMLI